MAETGKKTFHEWYCELYKLAEENECEWLIPPEKAYPTDGYADENTPNDELNDLISYGIDYLEGSESA